MKKTFALDEGVREAGYLSDEPELCSGAKLKCPTDFSTFP